MPRQRGDQCCVFAISAPCGRTVDIVDCLPYCGCMATGSRLAAQPLQRRRLGNLVVLASLAVLATSSAAVAVTGDDNNHKLTAVFCVEQWPDFAGVSDDQAAAEAALAEAIAEWEFVLNRAGLPVYDLYQLYVHPITEQCAAGTIDILYTLPSGGTGANFNGSSITFKGSDWAPSSAANPQGTSRTKVFLLTKWGTL